MFNQSPQLSFSRFLAALLLMLFAWSESVAEDPVDFVREVQPLLQQRCGECHGQSRQQSGLRLDRRAAMLRGGDHQQPTLIPGNPDESFLMHVVSGVDPDWRMPPEGEPLTQSEIALLKRWIEQGAPWPGQMDQSADEVHSDHWSLQRIETVSIPPTQTGVHPIDAFLQQRLQSVGLSLSPPADPVTALRRLSFVLTGLPPTPEDVDRFLSDPDGIDAAWERAVDRLLGSPRYGERWAQHWLDVIRWAETVGFETNLERPTAWPYRDWVIRSFNDDKPYDRFVLEQLAGDTVGEDAALGFLVAGPANLPGQVGRDEEAMRQSRQDELDEVIRTVSQSLMGLTIGCARCHNHKFDPILQRDYYSMQAIFAGLTYGDRRLRGEQNDQWNAKLPKTRERLNRAVADLEAFRVEQNLLPPLADLHSHRFEPVVARAIRMEIAATGTGAAASLYELEAWTPGTDSEASGNVALASRGAIPSASSFALANQTRHFDNLVDGSRDRRQAFPWVAEKAGPAWVQIDFAEPTEIEHIRWDRGSSAPADYTVTVLETESDQWIPIADTSRYLPREDDRRKADQIKLSGLSAETVSELVSKLSEVRAARAELSRLSAGPQVFAARFSDSPETTYLLHRGDPMQRRDEVIPAIPQVLGDLQLTADQPEPNRRLAFANHLISGGNPLAARVIVNRVWQHHFGAGLVDTPSDFGKMGSPPRHPELLDYLASDFVTHGWSLKRLHRQIVSTKAFRQSSQPRRDAIELDAESRLLWRYPPRRLEAESIRDSILQVSGKLNLKMGGKGFNLFRQRGGLSGYTPIETFDEEGWRRMIYAHKIRMQSVDIFGAFDCPDAGQMKPKRTRSITPTQSLSLFNSPMLLRQSEFFSHRVQQESSDGATDPIEIAFRLALSRPPTDDELERLTPFVQSEGLVQLCRVLFNTSEFLYIQ